MASGIPLVPVDLFPMRVGAVYGLANAIANIPGLLVPKITGAVLDAHGCPNGAHHKDISQRCKDGWFECLFIAGGVTFFGAIVFAVAITFDKRYQELSQKKAAKDV